MGSDNEAAGGKRRKKKAEADRPRGVSVEDTKAEEQAARLLSYEVPKLGKTKSTTVLPKEKKKEKKKHKNKK